MPESLDLKFQHTEKVCTRSQLIRASRAPSRSFARVRVLLCDPPPLCDHVRPRPGPASDFGPSFVISQVTSIEKLRLEVQVLLQTCPQMRVPILGGVRLRDPFSASLQSKSSRLLVGRFRWLAVFLTRSRYAAHFHVTSKNFVGSSSFTGPSCGCPEACG